MSGVSHLYVSVMIISITHILHIATTYVMMFYICDDVLHVMRTHHIAIIAHTFHIVIITHIFLIATTYVMMFYICDDVLQVVRTLQEEP